MPSPQPIQREHAGMNIYIVVMEAGIIFCTHSAAADEALSMFPQAYVEVWDTAKNHFLTIWGVQVAKPEDVDG